MRGIERYINMNRPIYGINFVLKNRNIAAYTFVTFASVEVSHMFSPGMRLPLELSLSQLELAFADIQLTQPLYIASYILAV